MIFSKIFFAVFISVIGVLLLGAGRVKSQDLVSARVLSSEGQVEIQRQPGGQPQLQKIAFKVDDELRAGDTIITGKNGRLVLSLSDGSQAVIASQTTVVIKDLNQSPRKLFNIVRGKTRIHIEKLGGRPNPYRVNTPTAVIAVRGTIFDVVVDGDETQVFLHEGEVIVTGLAAPDQPVTLSAGQMTRVRMQRSPNAPSQFKTGRNDEAFKTGKTRNDAGDDRVNSNDGSSQGNRRIAVNGANQESGRRETQSAAGRGGAQSNGSGPNMSPKSAGRRP